MKLQDDRVAGIPFPMQGIVEQGTLGRVEYGMCKALSRLGYTEVRGNRQGRVGHSRV